MASKDEVYDPSVNYDSGSDCELNNAQSKFASSPSPPSSPLSDVIHNNLHGSGRGPQADNDDAKGATGGGTAETRKCSNCKHPTTEHYEAARYQCHGKYKKYPAEIAKHNTLCKDCAFDHKKCPKCPIHIEPLSGFALRVTPKRVWTASK